MEVSKVNSTKLTKLLLRFIEFLSNNSKLVQIIHFHQTIYIVNGTLENNNYLTKYLILAGDGRLNIYHDYAQQLVRWTELMIELLEGMEVNLLFIYKPICEFKWFINI